MGNAKVYYDKASYDRFCNIIQDTNISWEKIKSIANGKSWAWTEEKYNKNEIINNGFDVNNIVETRGIEIGHNFVFGDKYTKSMNVKIKDDEIKTIEIIGIMKFKYVALTAPCFAIM